MDQDKTNPVEGVKERLAEALARIDEAVAKCPVNSFGRKPDRCAKCGATSSQNCAPHVSALAHLEIGVRELTPALLSDHTRLEAENAAMRGALGVALPVLESLDECGEETEGNISKALDAVRTTLGDQ